MEKKLNQQIEIASAVINEINKTVAELRKVETLIRRGRDGFLQMFYDNGKIISLDECEIEGIKSDIIGAVAGLVYESKITIKSAAEVGVSKDYDTFLKALSNIIIELEIIDEKISNNIGQIERLANEIEMLKNENNVVKLPFSQDFQDVSWLYRGFRAALLRKKEAELQTEVENLEGLLKTIVK
ncbi:MAG: hypothetical protein ABIK73_07815 [candidate division WOR-3 bacterium]